LELQVLEGTKNILNTTAASQVSNVYGISRAGNSVLRAQIRANGPKMIANTKTKT